MGRQNTGRVRKLYRLSLVENHTHKSIKTIYFTKRRFITTTVAALVLLALLIFAIIAVTPLRTLIPGYPDANSKKVSMENAIKIDSLESAMLRWDIYAAHLSKVLTGETTVNFDSLLRQTGSVRYLSDKSAEELAARDSLLRETVAAEERFGLSANAMRSLPVEGMHFFSPLKGVIIEDYELSRHPGVNVSAPLGTIVSAVADGTVVYCGRSNIGGYTVIIQHRDNVLSIYGNNSEVTVSAGQQVSAGSPVAMVGREPGSQNMDYLHFELWHDGKSLDPTYYISF